MRIGLALGGGGARGAAHLGVLVELDRLGLQPDQITGTSIGGLVGAMVAAGKQPVEIGRFFEKLTFGNAYSIPTVTSPQSLSANNKLEQLLEQSIGRPTFADLRLPLALVAVDLYTRKEVILDSGDVITAILATTALPILMPPVAYDDHMLVDGGLLNNVPFDVARARGATTVIAVDLSNTATYGVNEFPKASGLVARSFTALAKIPVWQVGLNTIDIVMGQTFFTRLAIVQPEIVLRPWLGTMGLLDFHRFEEAFEAGQKAVRESEADIRAVLRGEIRSSIG